MNKIVVSITRGYLVFSIVLGVYGGFFAAFSPSKLSVQISEAASLIFFVYYSPAILIFVWRRKSEILSHIPSRLKRWFMCLWGLPFFVLTITYLNYCALASGVPSIAARIFAEGESAEVFVVKKHLRGKRDSREELFISGFKRGFPVSRRFYNSVSVGEKITVSTRKTSFGTHVEF